MNSNTATTSHHIKFNTGLTLLSLQQTQARLAALQIRLAAKK